jgi:hypothetical protein
MPMKTYSTFAGARRASRAAGDKPILRLLDDPRELYVLLPSVSTRLMAVDSKGGACDGSITYEELATRT